MVGTAENPVQIDESRFAGRRKYNRGRMLQGDHAPKEIEEDIEVENNRNHGRRIDGPWVFGLMKGNDCRYFYVQRRDADTLVPIIQREVTVGSVIHSDKWRAYSGLNRMGYIHSTVNQGVERSWLDAKVQILKEQRGVSATTFQSHLDYYCWRQLNKNSDDIFLTFLSDVRTIHR